MYYLVMYFDELINDWKHSNVFDDYYDAKEFSKCYEKTLMFTRTLRNPK